MNDASSGPFGAGPASADESFAREVPDDIVLITPGVRPAGSDVNDQKRIATPEQALSDGANLLVIGRPITAAVDVAAAAWQLAEATAAWARA